MHDGGQDTSGGDSIGGQDATGGNIGGLATMKMMTETWCYEHRSMDMDVMSG